jgi:hypothetical protein
MKRTESWSQQDSADAIAQGWEIFSTDRAPSDHPVTADGSDYGYRPFELQAINESGVFEDDPSAWKFVTEKASRGDQLALRAMEFLRINSPAEYSAIISLMESKQS